MSNHPPRIRFLGGAGTVTGSKTLVTYQEQNILVDCGLFQGLKELRLKNWDRFPIDPNKIHAIVLTHAHIDHSAYIPRLVREGFRGPIYCSEATYELCRVMLLDTAHLQEEEAEWLNKRKLSKHSPALPLYTVEDVEKALHYFSPQKLNVPFSISEHFKCELFYAGHILGATMAHISIGGKTILFSGDLGRPEDPVLLPPAQAPKSDYLVLESTYGNKLHKKIDALLELETIIKETMLKNGTILIPAFTVGRSQTLMYFLSELQKTQRIDQIPMYLNSPMATTATNIYCDHKDLHKLDLQECNAMSGYFTYIKSVEESKKLNEDKKAKIIIAGSGMITGGRILHHLEAFLSIPSTTVILSGFQAVGTRGRLLQEGAPEIKIHGKMVPVKASVKTLENLSAHADYSEILDWLKTSDLRPQKIFLNHGEPESLIALAQHINSELQLQCELPKQDQEFIL